MPSDTRTLLNVQGFDGHAYVPFQPEMSGGPITAEIAGAGPTKALSIVIALIINSPLILETPENTLEV